MKLLKISLPNPWMFIIILILSLFFILKSKAQINVDNKKILIIGNIYYPAPAIMDNFYKNDSVIANKKFNDAAIRISKFGTPVLITDLLKESEYSSQCWLSVFEWWSALVLYSQEFYIIKGEKDGLMENMLFFYTSKIFNQSMPDSEISLEIINIVQEKRNLLMEVDTTKTVYYNTLCTRTVTKKNCPEGYSGTKVTYKVPAKKYCSLISQLKAQEAAQLEAETYKQETANMLGICIQN